MNTLQKMKNRDASWMRTRKPYTSSNTIAAWGQATTYPLKALDEECMQGFGPDLKRSMDHISPHEFRVDLLWEGEAETAWNTFTINFGTRTIHSEDTYVPVSMRGHRFGPRFLGINAQIGHRLQFNTMSFDVAGELGALVWSRADIMPNDDTRMTCSCELEERLRLLDEEQILTPSEKDVLTSACKLQKPGDLKRIAGLRRVLPTRANMLFLNLMEPTDAYFGLDAVELLPPTLTLAKFMLARICFSTQIDLTCPERLSQAQKNWLMPA